RGTGPSGAIGSPEVMVRCEPGGSASSGLSAHDEASAMANAASQGIGLARSVCHVPHFPCAPSAKLLVAAGVCAVYWAEEYRDTALAEKIFAEAAVATVRIGRWTA